MAFVESLEKNGLEAEIKAHLSKNIKDVCVFTQDKDANTNRFNQYKRSQQDNIKKYGIGVSNNNLTIEEIKESINSNARVLIGVNMGEYFSRDFKDDFPQMYEQTKEGIEAGEFNYNHVISIVGYEPETDRFIFEETIKEAPAQIMYMKADTLKFASENVLGNEGNVEGIIFYKK